MAIEREVDASSALLHFVDGADQREAEPDVEIGVAADAAAQAKAGADEAAVVEGAAAPDAAAVEAVSYTQQPRATLWRV